MIYIYIERLQHNSSSPMFTLIQLSNLEQKTKSITKELECQRHNAEAARLAQEQRFKEREKEHKQEASQQNQTLTTMDKQLNEVKAKSTQEVNRLAKEKDQLAAQMEKATFEKQKLEAELKELQQKVCCFSPLCEPPK